MARRASIVARLVELVLATAIAVASAIPAAAGPRELAPIAALEARCADSCSRDDRVDLALHRAAAWLQAFPGELRFDAAVLLTLIRGHVDSDALRAAFAVARRRADHDHDHPHRRLWVPEMRSPPEHTTRWQPPAAGEKRANTNRPLSEALHCRENGWRAATESYVCGAMRDDGGYQTTHAIWALDIARRNGCTEAAACLESLRAELRRSQPEPFAPVRTLDIDLFAERLALYARTGPAGDVAESWVDTLLELQKDDGSWRLGDDPDPYFGYHATAASAWALAEWGASAARGSTLRNQKIH